ncbi:MAG: heavy metal translocating P-type ATPase metal-binding domain-containing protein [Thermoanaerobaculia bacterium]|nr:heavy metal translocating P-type ATPase metal-binding domain-containing protein [Thermoanaerobaculia bacterium]
MQNSLNQTVVGPCCEHCGAPSSDGTVDARGRTFCCLGCRAVFELLDANGLSYFYRLEAHPGPTIEAIVEENAFTYLDRKDISRRLLAWQADGSCRVTLRIPAIHCVACVWLLENLYRFSPAIGESRVVFPRQELTVHFDPSRLKLSALVHQLSKLGYPPALCLDSLNSTEPVASSQRHLVQRIGIAGFVAGNTMLFSISSYLGLATSDGLARFMSYVSLALALPVVTYCAADFWRAAWFSLRGRVVSLDVPIALGLAALFGQSLFEIVTAHGGGYLDSLSALVFLLLIGRWVQDRAFESLRFDRNYADYFPLSATTLVDGGERIVPLTELRAGDRIVVRHGELLPVDGTLASGEARIDYSFVTGESDPVIRQAGDELLAGGRQVGGAIEINATRSVNSSGLVALWNQTGSEGDHDSAQTLISRAARWFTGGVISIAVASFFYWIIVDSSLALRSFVSVLIVACPCALALAAPFATGAARHWLARHGLFLRSPSVVERLAQCVAAVFDKTGTLTEASASVVSYRGKRLAAEDSAALAALLTGSSHPFGLAVRRFLGNPTSCQITAYEEIAGAGCRGLVERRSIACGSREWLASCGTLNLPTVDESRTSTVHWASDRVYRGRFDIVAPLRPELSQLMQNLGRSLRLVVTSGDSDRDRDRLVEALGSTVSMSFRQSPGDKRQLVEELQHSGPVMMIGDGLNDGPALRQSSVRIAVAEDVSVFAPACDALLQARELPRLAHHLQFSRHVLTVIKICFAVSIAYNLIGLGFAVTGQLAPVVSAILMPLSSLTVVGLAVGLTHLAARWTLTIR